jgi:hypothetical protein
MIASTHHNSKTTGSCQVTRYLGKSSNQIFQLGLFFSYCCAGWGYIVAFIKALIIYQIYHIWIHLLHHSSLFPPFPIPKIVAIIILFHFYTCAHSIVLYSPSQTISPPLPPSHWYQHHPLLLDFVKEQKRDFYLFKITIQGVPLWHFHVHMYCSTNWFISIFLLSSLVPFLWWFQEVWNFCI